MSQSPTTTDESKGKPSSPARAVTLRSLGIKPRPGLVWNPLLRLPPNRKCPCQSGLKFKKCCRDKLPKAVPEKDADNFKLQMAKPDLVFITKENQEKLLNNG